MHANTRIPAGMRLVRDDRTLSSWDEDTARLVDRHGRTMAVVEVLEEEEPRPSMSFARARGERAPRRIVRPFRD